MISSNKILDILIETERVADQILQNKQEIIALDKRRQDTREALRKVEQSDEKKTWITVGTLLMKMHREKALELLTKGLLISTVEDKTAKTCLFPYTDQNTINIEINKLRSDQKILVNKHRDLEHEMPVKGFDLKPLSRAEVNVMRDNLPGF